MDVVLVDRRRSFRAQVEATLLPGDRLVEINEQWLAAGHWLPNAAATRAVLLAVHHADATLLRALHRLWSAEHAPACYLLSATGSAGEQWLQALLGAPLLTPQQQARGRRPVAIAGAAAAGLPARSAAPRWRAVANLSLTQLLALDRLAASQTSYQNE